MPIMKMLPVILAAALFPAAAGTAEPGPSAPAPILLWPGAAPGDTGTLGEEKDLTKPGEGLVAGKSVIRLANVARPTMTVFPPPAGKGNGAAVLICPGGGYHILAMDLEGTEVVEWLNSIGVTGILLKYRVPVRPGRPRHEAPLQDAQRAMGIARSRAGEWGIDPGRIGVLGFSAGGHLSAALSTNFEKRLYEPVDGADRASCRPDFAVLVYPAYLTVEKELDRIAPELPIGAATPPTFLVQSWDDPVPAEGTLAYSLALKRAKVPVEIHLYPSGGHGYGLRPAAPAVTRWPLRAEEWLRGMGVLGQK